MVDYSFMTAEEEAELTSDRLETAVDLLLRFIDYHKDIDIQDILLDNMLHETEVFLKDLEVI